MTIYLVKEADSGSPSSWPGPARLRPITREGRRQAKALVACLQGHPISRVLTGPNLRCRETVMPLADARDLVIESVHDLGEMADVDRALEVVRGAASRPVLVCTCASLVDAMVGKLLLDGWMVEDDVAVADGFVWLVEDVVLEAS